MDDQGFTQYVNAHAPQIEGWFYPADMLAFYRLSAIQRSIGIAGNLCEVGVWHAKSLVLLSRLAADGERCLGFDLFPDDLEARARENVARYGAASGVELIAGDSSAMGQARLAPKLMPGLRFLHIDAGHEYHEVMHQLMLFAPFVVTGGVIAMDDYQDREFPGIEAATLDFCDVDRPRRFVPFFAGANKMYLCELAFATTYQKALLSVEPIASGSRVSRVRDFNVLVGFSKLPAGQQRCLEALQRLSVPFDYDMDEARLAQRSERFSQLHFGYGDASR